MENIEKDIQLLKDSKLDRILIENVNTGTLSKIDTSGETDAVKETISVLTDLINKLKSK